MSVLHCKMHEASSWSHPPSYLVCRVHDFAGRLVGAAVRGLPEVQKVRNCVLFFVCLLLHVKFEFGSPWHVLVELFEDE